MNEPVDLEAIEETWLRQCGACDAGLAMSCTCPQGDHRNVIASLADEVLRLRIQIATAEDQATTTWSLPTEPGPDVLAVRCDCCGFIWTRDSGPGRADLWVPSGSGMLGARDWRPLVIEHTVGGSKLRDATEDGTS